MYSVHAGLATWNGITTQPSNVPSVLDHVWLTVEPLAVPPPVFSAQLDSYGSSNLQYSPSDKALGMPSHRLYHDTEHAGLSSLARWLAVLGSWVQHTRSCVGRFIFSLVCVSGHHINSSHGHRFLNRSLQNLT